MLKRSLTVLLILIILAVVGAIVWLAIMPHEGNSFTEFYILGQDGKADNYPSQIKLGDNVTISMSVINRENTTMSYHVIVQMKEILIQEMGPVILTNNGKWEQQVNFTPIKVGDNQTVEFLLYKDDGINPYLSLNLLVNVK